MAGTVRQGFTLASSSLFNCSPVHVAGREKALRLLLRLTLRKPLEVGGTVRLTFQYLDDMRLVRGSGRMQQEQDGPRGLRYRVHVDF